MSHTPPRVLYFGTSSAFSLPPLARLLDAGFLNCGLVIPRERAPDTSLPMLGDSSALRIDRLARERGIPIVPVDRLDDRESLAALAALQPDVLCVACFPRRLPPAVLALPRYGCLNVHPSLLPRHRGPAPLFWAFHNGDTETGVTIHIMDDGIDSGDILLQEAVPIPEGIRGAELEQTCAKIGARLLVDAILRLTGAVEPATLGRPQAPHLGSYESWPTSADLRLPRTRPARWAFRFIRGVGDWYPLTIPVEEQRLPVGEALGYSEESEIRTFPPPQGQSCRIEGDEAWIAFQPGVLHIRLR
jgi:methionyl-tRNA formyltransferase